MKFNVYMIIAKKKGRYTTYVGYTKNIEKRLFLHNTSKGAKFTKGCVWKVIYHENYDTKSKALKAEYRLKKNYKFRSRLKSKYIKDENINIASI